MLKMVLFKYYRTEPDNECLATYGLRGFAQPDLTSGGVQFSSH